jgi:MoaA/NifB/PqqE/SkfB family radical SAM enzyme
VENLGYRKTLRLFLRGNRNYIYRKPLVVSFELTASCNANCLHCDKGGIRPEETPLSPSQIGRIYRELSPVVVQLSGGEPLLRTDLVEVVHQVRERNGNPYLILVTNAHLLNCDSYRQLRRAGIDQVSISLDFPDERHDAFREIPGLFRHLARLVPELAACGNGDIVINTAISKLNLEDLVTVCETASSWGVSVSYSAYSALRTGNRELLISSRDDLRRLREQIDQLVRMKRAGWRIRNPYSDLENIWRFFAEDGIGGCRAGHRFLLITPEGYYRPCAHKPLQCRSRAELIEEFSRANTCRGCYVAIRSYCDKSYGRLIREQFFSRMVHR